MYRKENFGNTQQINSSKGPQGCTKPPISSASGDCDTLPGLDT